MSWTRREILKTGIAAAAAPVASIQTQSQPGQSDAPAAAVSSQRERLLLDLNWRFQLGHADDPSKDFGLGSNAGAYAKSGTTVTPARANFDDSAWQQVDLPHDWAIELPFENAESLTAHGSYPLGRRYPATSIGWYRRVFDLPASDLGWRLFIEFDGVFRNA